jgi:hypothetical protein
VTTLEDWKIKISVLWLFWTVAFLITLVAPLFEPGAMQQISSGVVAGMQMTLELILAAVVMMLVPLVMAFLSLTLRDSVIRWANVVLGVAYTGICLFDWLGSPAQPSYQIVLYISKITVSALIVWYAWKP